jgi:murein DD-endopeptidase MepM/ murein hydrolase activator NlpD
MADWTGFMSISDLGKAAGAASRAAKAAKTAGDVAKTSKTAGDVAKAAGGAARAAGDAPQAARAAGGAANAASKISGAPRGPGSSNASRLGSPAKVSVPSSGAPGVPATPTSPGGATSVGLPKGLDAPLGGPSKPVAKTTFKSDLKNAAVGGGPTTAGEKQSLRAAAMEVAGAGAKGVASGAVAGAVAGAGAGAVPGLIIGGVKDAGLALVRNKRFRGIAISVAAFLIVVPLVFALVTFVILSSSMTAINQANNAASQSAAAAEIENEAIAEAFAQQEQYGVPWTIVAAMQAKGLSTPEGFTNVGKQLVKIDPDGQFREMDAGGTYSVTSPGRIVNDADTVATASSGKVKETYVAAIVAGAPTDKATAEKVYNQALRWALGQEQSCKLPEDTGGSDVLMNVKGVPATNAQIDVATTIIGITKTVTAAMSAEDQVRAAEITIATGIVESVLTNHDKKVDHTSLGVFQQQDWWGTDAQRLRVDWSTARFLKPLLMLAGWNTMEPGAAAQKIQVSAFPDEYTKRMGEAKIIVSNLWNDSPALPLPADSDMGTVAPPAGAPVNTACLTPVAGAFVLPFVGYTPMMTSWYGKRVSPGGIGSTNHGGVDFGAPTGTPVVSIGDGTVNGVGSNRYAGCGYWITIEMPDGEARYCHFNVQSPMKVGDLVTAGQPIGVVGSTGDSTGPHLHLNINVAGVPTDPYYFLLDRGIDLELLPYWSKIGPH